MLTIVLLSILVFGFYLPTELCKFFWAANNGKFKQTSVWKLAVFCVIVVTITRKQSTSFTINSSISVFQHVKSFLQKLIYCFAWFPFFEKSPMKAPYAFSWRALFSTSVHSSVFLIKANCSLHTMKPTFSLGNSFVTDSILEECIWTAFMLVGGTDQVHFL